MILFTHMHARTSRICPIILPVTSPSGNLRVCRDSYRMWPCLLLTLGATPGSFFGSELNHVHRDSTSWC